MFDDVELLGEQRRRTAGRPIAFEPAHRIDLVALLVFGQGHEESAEQEGAFGVGQGPLVLPEAVDVAVTAEFGAHGPQSLGGARIAGR